MNSTEGLKGFATFVLLSGIIGLSYLGLRYLPESASNASQASGKAFEPVDLKVSKVAEKSAEITWQTREPSIGIVFYSEDEDCFKSAKLEESSCSFKTESKATNEHKIKLDKLKPGTTYFYKIKSDVYAFPENSRFSFSTQKSSDTEDDDSNGIKDSGVKDENGLVL